MNALAGDTSRVGLFKRNLGMNAAAMAMAMAEAVNGLDSEAQSLFANLGSTGAAANEEGKRLADETSEVFQDIVQGSKDVDNKAEEVESAALSEIDALDTTEMSAEQAAKIIALEK